MEIVDLLTADNVFSAFKATSKKQAIQSLAKHIAKKNDLSEQDVFLSLLDREKLGSTGVGKGVAIPHTRVNGLDRIIGVFARLSHPINFESVDEQPVDLIFLLLAPAEGSTDHLKALARVSRLLRDEKTCEKLRMTSDSAALYAMLAATTTSVAA